MSRFSGERITMFMPNIGSSRTEGNILVSIPLAGIHPEVADVPIAGTNRTIHIGSTTLYRCPFTGEDRTLWGYDAPVKSAAALLFGFAADNAPDPKAQRFLKSWEESIQTFNRRLF